VLSVGADLHLRLEGEGPVLQTPEGDALPGTLAVASTTKVTLLVGDIRDYTVLVQQSESAGVQESVSRVFARLEKGIEELGGTLKEFQGDAIFAFWEEGPHAGHAIQACRAALEMDRLSKSLAADPEVWQVDDFPLKLDWALATGLVAISGHGNGNALGLSMVGEPVVLAFRIEKFADDQTGNIVACPVTREMAASDYEFRDLGTRKPKGFDAPQQIFALVGAK
jgi:class 3 adenylate cyclase